MKKNYMLIALLCASYWVYSQNLDFLSIQNREKKADFSVSRISQNQNQSARHSQTSYGSIIGTTTYDMQSNYGSGSSRILNYENGLITAVWMQSLDANGAHPDRGTGYNVYDPQTQSWGAGITDWHGLATFRAGWPQIVKVDTGELVLQHNFGAAHIGMNRRDTLGDGWWGMSFTQGFDGVWPKAASVGDTIHMITLNNQNTVNGITNGLEYHRSNNRGDSWAINNYHNFQDLNTSTFKFSKLDADAYAIDAYKNYVAFVVGGCWDPVVLYKSDDYGNSGSWTKTVIFEPDSSYGYSDAANSLKIVPTLSSDFSIVLDETGMVHLSSSGFAISWPFGQDIPHDNSGDRHYYPLASLGAYYWNENMGTIDFIENEFITSETASGNVLSPISLFEDYTGDGNYNIPANTDSVGKYNGGISGQTTIAVDDNSGVFIVWSQVAEITMPVAPKLYRDLYFAYSLDNGQSWSDAFNLASLEVNDDGFTGGTISEEDVFPSSIRRIGSDNKMHITFQSDIEPGMHVHGDLHPITVSDIVHYPIDITYFRNLSSVNNEIAKSDKINIYPNPSRGEIFLENLDIDKIENIELLNIIGQVVMDDISYTKEANRIRINLSNSESGIFLLKIDSGGDAIIRKIIRN